MDLDRGRKHLFDSQAELYDRYRPGYPEQLVDDIIGFSGVDGTSRILEVGSGTGKATVQFAKRELSIECLDPGAELCGVLRRNCSGFPRVSVQAVEYEKADLETGVYDLVYSAQAFHWVLPSVRYRKAQLHLKSGGVLAVFWNYYPDTQDPALREIDALFRRRVPETLGHPAFPYRKTISRWRKELNRQSAFEGLSIREYPWSEQYSAEAYVRLYHTHSDFLALPGPLRNELSLEMNRIIAGNGGFVERSYVCVLYCLRKRRWED